MESGSLVGTQTFWRRSQAESREVSTTCVSGVDQALNIADRVIYPPAHAGGTDFTPRRSLFRRFLGSSLIGAVTAPDSFQSIWSNLVSNKSAALAANADGDVAALLDPNAVSVITPNESVEVAGRLDGKLCLVFFAVGILARRLVVSF